MIARVRHYEKNSIAADRPPLRSPQVYTAMMASLAPLANLAPYHIMLYGTLLGTELYQVFPPLPWIACAVKLNPLQSFVMTKVCYNALPMPAFTTLQKRVFPAYFRLQSLLFLLTAATHPPYGPVSLVSSAGDLAPMALGGALAALNLVVYGPRTQEAMVERIHQGDVFGVGGDDTC